VRRSETHPAFQTSKKKNSARSRISYSLHCLSFFHWSRKLGGGGGGGAAYGSYASAAGGAAGSAASAGAAGGGAA
jgi:hypothetical protein